MFLKVKGIFEEVIPLALPAVTDLQPHPGLEKKGLVFYKDSDPMGLFIEGDLRIYKGVYPTCLLIERISYLQRCLPYVSFN